MSTKCSGSIGVVYIYAKQYVHHNMRDLIVCKILADKIM